MAPEAQDVAYVPDVSFACENLLRTVFSAFLFLTISRCMTCFEKYLQNFKPPNSRLV